MPARRPAEPALPRRRTQGERRAEAEHRLLEAAMGIVAQRGTVRMTLAEVGEAAGYSRGLPAHHFGSKAGLLHALAGYIGERFGQQRARGPALQPGLDAILGNIRFYFDRGTRAARATRVTRATRAARAAHGAGTSGAASTVLGAGPVPGPAAGGGEDDGAFTAMRALLVMMNESCMAPGTAPGEADDAAATLRAEVAAYNRSAVAWFEHHIRVGIAQGEIAPGTPPQTTALILLGAMRGVMLQWLVDPRLKLGAVRDQLLAITRQVLAPGPRPAAPARPVSARARKV